MKSSYALSLIASLFILSGCTLSQPEPKTEVSLATDPQGNVTVNERNITTPSDTNITDAERYKIVFETPPLTGVLKPEELNKKQPHYRESTVQAPPPEPITITDNRPVKLSVEKIPVGKFAEVALGSVLGINYVITPDAAVKSNPVSLNMSSNMKAKDFLAIAQKIMNDNGLQLNQEAGSTIFVTLTPPKIDPKFNPSIQDTTIYYGRSIEPNIPDSKQITMFIPYYYVDMRNQITQIRSLALSPNTTTQIFHEHNVMMVKDLAGSIRKALVYIDLFDRPMMKDKTAQIIPLQYVGAKNFAERVREILPTLGVPIAKKTSDLGLFIQELPEMQSLLILSDKQEWVDQLLFWRKKFDSLSALGDSPRMFVYQVKNRKAAELVSLASGVQSSPSTDNTPKGSNPEGGASAKAPAKTATAIGGSLLGDTKMIADTNTNSLIIYATPERYREIETVLNTIDTLPRQVMVEVTIAELTLTDKLSYGLEWYLKNNGTDYSGTIQTMGNLGLGSGGLTGSILKNTADFSAMINMFAQKNLINILSTPKLVVLDNQSATINVGTEVPVLSSQTSASQVESTTTTVQQSVQYRNTGIILSVTPTVNSGGVLTLKINQSVSEAQQNSLSSISSPLILNRSIDTNVVLRSGESVILGGLMSENKSDGNTRVPLFGDIPLLGNLFKTTSKSTTKTELIVLVKPVIIENLDQHSELTQAIGAITPVE